VREAHSLLIGQLERIDARVTELVETVTTDAARRNEELSGEVHMLEDMVAAMGERLESRSADQVDGRPQPGAQPLPPVARPAGDRPRSPGR
jgi:cyclic-di-GMP phosphodiesterase TipF (flagellum assembly factor)